MSGTTDLLVVGGGPVGLGTAVLAALGGLEAVVVEKRADPVDKACGEGLMPGALAALRELGVDPPGHDLAGIAYVQDGRRAEARFRCGPGRGVRRITLHAALAARADALGVDRLPATVTGLRQGEGWVEAAGVRARWAAVADGLHSPLRRQLGLAAPARGVPRYGLRRHYRLPPWSDLVEVHWSARAEAYVTPVADDLVGVAVLGPGGAPYADALRDFPALADRLAAAQPVTPVRGAGPLRQAATGRRADRALLVGDAAGYLDALTGEGIAVGLACARALVDALLADRPEDYEAAWRRVTRRYRALTGALLWASRRPALRPRLVPAAVRAPRAYATLVDLLA